MAGTLRTPLLAYLVSPDRHLTVHSIVPLLLSEFLKAHSWLCTMGTVINHHMDLLECLSPPQLLKTLGITRLLLQSLQPNLTGAITSRVIVRSQAPFLKAMASRPNNSGPHNTLRLLITVPSPAVSPTTLFIVRF
ncbi:hypothetical protein BD779DRAFT_1681350 [Infundibulicybe gibba]|nr:hypothetical protein BD779DRAFT_1681350 [Infundibulicybe gibba]